MKRFFKTALTVTLATTLLLTASGCDGCDGCNSTPPIAFNNYFIGADANEPSFGYSETLTYTVTDKADYNTILKKATSLKDDIAKYSFNGTYTMTLNVLGSLPNTDSAGNQISTDIDWSGKNVYHLKSQLLLDATYKVNGEFAQGFVDSKDTNIPDGKTYEDSILSEVYFLAAGQSFAPIWSTTKVKNSILTVGDKANVNLKEYEVQTAYNNGSYKTTIKNGEEVSSSNSEYKFKRAIDSNQLLFAIRNLDIGTNASKTISTVSSTYSQPQGLVIANNAENTKTVNVNGQTVEVPVKNLTVKRSDKFNTGIPQYILLQKEAKDDLLNKSLIIEYAAPLTTYGTFLNMGALVYTLSSTNYN